MKNLKILMYSVIFSIALILVAGFPLVKTEQLSATYSGDFVNNVIFVTFEEDDNAWQNQTPNSYYTSDIKTIMENSYNNSSSSVNSYYKTMSFNSLNLTSNFYFADSSKTQSYTVPYTKNELITYSKTNTTGYLQHEVCTYTSSYAPDWLTLDYLISTTHQFSCYECGNSSYSGTHYNCDLDTSDGIGCYCAYKKFTESNSKTVLYKHLEEYIREQIALKTVLNQISSFDGNIDSDNDGYIDAMTFIFPHADGVNWGELLWAHEFEVINFEEYLPSYMLSPQTLLTILTAHGVRNEAESSINTLINKINISSKTCKSYNLYLFSDLVKDYYDTLIGADGKEIAKVFTLAHELGHVLGLPDYYTYESETGEEDPVDIWDLMSYSYYSAPTYMTTYNRELLGFTNSSNVKALENAGTYTLKPTCFDEINNNNNNSNNVLAYVLEDPSFPGQKIYLEYRYKGGKFEPAYSAKEDGLIIYRADNNINQISDYGVMLSSGNFCSYPFNLYVFRNGDNFALNNTNNTFGNSNLNSNMNAITFQTYDSSKDQLELEKTDITFHNSGIVIENVFINPTTNELTFTISGGYLKDPSQVDLSGIQLIGEENIYHEVNTTYFDAGVNFAEFNMNELNVDIQNNVKSSEIGNYTITYTITHTASQKYIVLTRNIIVRDTTKPTISLIGNATITLVDINDYIESGLNYSDNYDAKSQLQLTILGPTYNTQTGNYVVTYRVVDTSGNETIIQREIIIEEFDPSQITLIGDANVVLEVNNTYTEYGVNYGNYSESQFEVDIISNVITNELGDYTYQYNFIFKPTQETFSLTRNVSVVDTTAPEIELLGELTLEIYRSQVDSFVDPGYNFSDNYDTNLVTYVYRTNTSDTEILINYYAKDASGNENTKFRALHIIEKPINAIDNQLNITIKNNITNIYPNAQIVFEVDYVLLNDNNQNPEIKFYLDDQQIISGVNGKTLTIKFFEKGVYNLKVMVGEAEIYKQIIVKDSYDNNKDSNSSLIVIIVVSMLILFGIICFIKLKSRANKIKQRIDKY